MLINYQFFPNEHLLVIQYEGLFCANTHKKAATILKGHKEFTKIKKLFFDVTNTRMGERSLVVQELIQMRDNSQPMDYKVAYWVRDPKVHANLQLYANLVNPDNYQYFTTLHAVINHLNLDISVPGLENRIKNLNNHID
jgi:hypothetical protein